jgi:hypothetical protein
MSEAAGQGRTADVFQALDDAKISRFQIKTMFVSGMGFFTDAYGLFVIGIVVSLLKTQWSLSTNQVSWLNSATLLASLRGGRRLPRGPGQGPGRGARPAGHALRARAARPRHALTRPAW